LPPPTLEQTPWTLVQTKEQLEEMIRHMRQVLSEKDLKTHHEPFVQKITVHREFTVILKMLLKMYIVPYQRL
jgi:hypothetical protein